MGPTWKNFPSMDSVHGLLPSMDGNASVHDACNLGRYTTRQGIELTGVVAGAMHATSGR